MAKNVETVRSKLNTSWGQLDSEYASWKSHYMELSKFLMPRNGRYFTSDRNRGEKRHNSIYDNTGTRAAGTTGSGLLGGATSPARPWVRVVTPDEEANKVHPVAAWLDEVTKRILRVFAKSNTYRVLHQMYEELAVFGTAACLVMSDFDSVIHLYPLTVGEYRLAQDFKGRVNTCYRKFEKTVAEVVGEFGLDKCSKNVQEQFRSGGLRNPVTIVHVIEPRKDRDATKKDARNMPWKSCYYEEGNSEDRYLRESGFERFPVLAPRWSVVGGDVYGHGPGMEALGDVKQLQHEQLRKAQGIDQKCIPAVQAPTELKNRDVNFAPGGVTFVDSASATAGVRNAFEVNIDLADLLADIVDVRGRIRASFFADLFLMLSLAGTNTKMTATEVAERHEEKLLQLGPVLERLHNELLEPLVRLCYEELLKNGGLPPAPQELAGAPLMMEFISMLAQAQRAVGVAGVERVLGIAVGLAEAKPEILDNIDADRLWSEINDMIGVTPRITIAPKERDMLREARAKQQAAAMQSEQMAQNAGAVKDLAQAPTQSNSALSDIVSLFSGYDHPPAKAV